MIALQGDRRAFDWKEPFPICHLSLPFLHRVNEDGNSQKKAVFPFFIGYEDGNSQKKAVFPFFIGYEDGNSQLVKLCSAVFVRQCFFDK
ncbi:hypothetical protein A8F94_07850 [Bacillus sp. FJAT-27225]|nr:hypothetical protein A8F94_07850 [Bacillus sp. FJAT-27225]